MSPTPIDAGGLVASRRSNTVILVEPEINPITRRFGLPIIACYPPLAQVRLAGQIGAGVEIADLRIPGERQRLLGRLRHDAPALLAISVTFTSNGDEAIDLVSSFGLEGVLENPADQISFGQQKLLALACVLATGASILLLDEPVSGVDPSLSVKILDHLARIHDEGRTVLFIEHDLAAVQKIARNVVLMSNGRVVAEGLSGDIFGQPDLLEVYID